MVIPKAGKNGSCDSLLKEFSLVADNDPITPTCSAF